MLGIILIVGIVVFIVSSAYFYYTGRKKGGLNTAFLVSFITLTSYVLMWQGDFAVTSGAGQSIFPTRWLFYGLSCTLLMYEIARLKKVSGGDLAQMIYLTAIVMVTGYLSARAVSPIWCVYFAISAIAYILLMAKVLSVENKAPKWVGRYVLFGWTVFPIVFALAPTGIGVIGAAIANLLYLLLDVYTKIVFNVQLAREGA
jgi:sensory rhodopsin